MLHKIFVLYEIDLSDIEKYKAKVPWKIMNAKNTDFFLTPFDKSHMYNLEKPAQEKSKSLTESALSTLSPLRRTFAALNLTIVEVEMRDVADCTAMEPPPNLRTQKDFRRCGLKNICCRVKT
jgi:hypothetical protein